jgi:hypothetical protein
VRSLLWIAYVVAGIYVAAVRDYFDGLNTIDELASAIFAVALWPLLVLGVDITLR